MTIPEPPSLSIVPELEENNAKRVGSKRPVFLHSSFRTSSTWVWERFRRSPNTTAYYEIFHEVLAEVSPAQVMGNHHASWESKHPSQAPYLVEFLNLMRGDGGVPEFDADMAFRSFIPVGGFEGALTSRESKYIDLLIRNATDNHTTPILTCTRSVGRVGALARAFPGCHILLYRRLFDQWASYSYHSLIGNNYFFDAMNSVISESDDPFIASIRECFQISSVDIKDHNLFYRFIFFHMYIYAHAFDDCDIVMDASACRDPDYQATIERKIHQSTSLSIELSGAQRNLEFSLLSVSDRGLFADTVRQFTKIICGAAPSLESASFVSGLAEQLLEDWSQNEFHTRRLRSKYVQSIDQLADVRIENQSLVDSRISLIAEAAECKVLADELSSAQSDIENIRKEAFDVNAKLSEELARSLAISEEISTNLSDSRVSFQALSNEKAVMHAEIASLKVKIDANAAELEALQALNQDLLTRFGEQNSEMRQMEADLRSAIAENMNLEQRLQSVQAAPPTLSRRIARLRRRVLKLRI